jgi:hypothetical protein
VFIIGNETPKDGVEPTLEMSWISNIQSGAKTTLLKKPMIEMNGSADLNETPK